ncbi:MAG: sigma factor-like helix-turn-helix DNA-binding protein, partial [Fimbriimonadales bacterium]
MLTRGYGHRPVGWAASQLTKMARDSFDWYERLSPKEREVLETYADEHSYESVARALGKSKSAVDQQ